MDVEIGLRERKKQRTRAQIAETARALFADRGFDSVSVAQIARAAEVSEATVFNYFPTKEDLVYQGMEIFEAELLETLRTRPAGQSVLEAFGRFVSQPRGMLAAENPGAQQELLRVSRMIAGSPTLLAREQQILSRYTESVAALLRDETGAGPHDLRPWIVAHALLGLHAALIDYARRRLLEDTPDLPRLARDLRREARRAVDQLRTGLADYATKPRERNWKEIS